MTPERKVRPRRTFIFSPGLDPAMFPKALASGADIVCVELEDGVAPKDKDIARERALALFAEPQADDGVERVVRINSVRERAGLADVSAFLATDTPLPVLMMPKVRTPDEVVWLDDLLTERDLPTELQVIIETNEGLEAAFEIARCSSRINALFFGGVDMAAKLRCANSWEPLLYARSRVVHAAAAAGLDVIDVPYLDLDDPRRYGDRRPPGPRTRVHRQGCNPPQTDRRAERRLHAIGRRGRQGSPDHRRLRRRPTRVWW